MAGEWKQTACNFCGVRCGFEMLVEDNKVVDMRPSRYGHGKDYPEPYCCRKGRSTKYFQDHPGRLNHPLKKVNGEFVQISWEQAYREIGQKLRGIIDQYGPKSFAICDMGLAGDQSDAAIIQAAFAACGGQYMYSPIGIEFAGNWWSHGRIVGHQGMVCEADEENIDIMIFWGSNSYVSHQIVNARTVIRERSERPDQMVIVVDPRMSETARMSDLHIHPKPGYDALMIRAMISLIVDKGWQDQEFLDKYCTGWERAKKEWYDGFNYREAFELCGVPYQQMEDFCHLLSHNVWGVHQDLGLFCGRHSTLNSYFLYELMAVTGCLELKGNKTMDSLVRFANPGDETTNKNMWKTVETGRMQVANSYPPAVLSDEIMSDHPEHIRAMYVAKANPARSYPDANRLEKALDKLDLLVVTEIVMTETAMKADYVLPGKTGFEEYQWTIFQGNPQFLACRLKHPILDQIEEREASSNILLEIMRAAGYIPEMPEKVYKAAEKSVEERDILVFMKAFLPWFIAHPKYKDSMQLLVGDALSRYLDGKSVSAAMFRAAAMISPLASLGYCERAGFGPKKKYKWMLKTPMKAMAQMSMMDNVFWALWDTPLDVIIGYPDPDPEKQMKNVITTKDGKIHLYDETAAKFIKNITVEKEREATAPTEEYPDLMSSGLHSDDGDNNTMRNNDTYRYRKPFKLFMNPVEAEKKGIKDGEVVRISTKAGHVDIPVEFTWRMEEGYCMMPHHMGLKNEHQPLYGDTANRIMSHEDYDEITSDPLIRYVPCRIDKIDEADAAAYAGGRGYEV